LLFQDPLLRFLFTVPLESVLPGEQIKEHSRGAPEVDALVVADGSAFYELWRTVV
jgi:hypothetical protein